MQTREACETHGWSQGWWWWTPRLASGWCHWCAQTHTTCMAPCCPTALCVWKCATEVSKCATEVSGVFRVGCVFYVLHVCQMCVRFSVGHIKCVTCEVSLMKRSTQVCVVWDVSRVSHVWRASHLSRRLARLRFVFECVWNKWWVCFLLGVHFRC